MCCVIKREQHVEERAAKPSAMVRETAPTSFWTLSSLFISGNESRGEQCLFCCVCVVASIKFLVFRRYIFFPHKQIAEEIMCIERE